MRKYKVALLLLCSAFLLPGWAGKLQTSPIRLDLSAEKERGVLTVTNEGQEKSMIQVETVSWHQEEGVDRYAPTQDLLVVPTLFELEAGESQLIRVGTRVKPDRDRERPYRIYLAELPATSSSESKSVRVMLRIGIPVFVHSPVEEASKLEWQASCRDRHLSLKASNVGNGHVKILAIKLEEAQKKSTLGLLKTADYLLPGTAHSWGADVSGCPAPGSVIELFAETDEGPLNVRVPLEE